MIYYNCSEPAVLWLCCHTAYETNSAGNVGIITDSNADGHAV